MLTIGDTVIEKQTSKEMIVRFIIPTDIKTDQPTKAWIRCMWYNDTLEGPFYEDFSESMLIKKCSL